MSSENFCVCAEILILFQKVDLLRRSTLIHQIICPALANREKEKETEKENLQQSKLDGRCGAGRGAKQSVDESERHKHDDDSDSGVKKNFFPFFDALVVSPRSDVEEPAVNHKDGCDQSKEEEEEVNNGSGDYSERAFATSGGLNVGGRIGGVNQLRSGWFCKEKPACEQKTENGSEHFFHFLG